MTTETSTGEFLFHLRQTMTEVDHLPLPLRPAHLEAGYRAQDQLVAHLVRWLGGSIIGYKVAATNVSAQRDMDVSGPFFGQLLSATSYPSSVHRSAALYTRRLMEPEFGFEMASDVPASTDPYTAESIRPYIASVFPAMELVNHRFTDWKKVGAPTLIADNALHGGWIFGTPVNDWNGTDLSRQVVRLIVNGREVHAGSGANVLGNPLNVVAWLANELPRFGKQLRRGDRISTGTTTEVYPARAGDHVVADFGVLGTVDMTFDT